MKVLGSLGLLVAAAYCGASAAGVDSVVVVGGCRRRWCCRFVVADVFVLFLPVVAVVVRYSSVSVCI